MGGTNQVPTPPPEGASYSRVSPAQAAADAIPLLVDDTYHLFHLTSPPFTKHHPPRLRSCWWRLQSKDLVHWTRDVEPSIKPGESTTAPDADGAWTGAAVLGPDGNMNIFYTGYNLSENGKQVILRTKSQDPHGAQFDYPGREISFNGDGRTQLEQIDFRDPYIFFNEEESQYWMIIASRLASGPHWSRGCIALLKSSDLDTWTFAPKPLYSPNDMFCPECPELFTLPNGKWYLVYSRFHAPNAGTVYRIADSPYGPFKVPRDGSHGRLDGRRWYAAKSCPKAGDPSKRIFFGWIGDYLEDERKWLWAGDLGVPREVSADSHGYLQVQPAGGIEELFEETSRAVRVDNVPSHISLSSQGTTTTHFPGLNIDESQDLLLNFEIQRCEAHSFGLILQADETQKGYRLQFMPSGDCTYTVSLLTGFPPLDDFWADQYDLHLFRPVDGPEITRHDGVVATGGISLLLRRQLLEFFVGGRSISFRLPMAADHHVGEHVESRVADRRLGWFVEDGDVQLDHVCIRYGGQISKTVM